MIGNSPISGGSFSGATIGNTSQKAVEFTLPSGSNYTLNSITLRLVSYVSALDTPLLQIYADSERDSTDPSNATLQSSLLFDKPDSTSNAPNIFTFNPQSTFTFLADTQYWLLVDGTSSSDYVWIRNATPTSPTGISGITSNGYQVSTNNGVSYSSNTVLSAFDIQATEVATTVPFDFDPSFGVAVLGGGWLLRKCFRKKSIKV